MAAFKMEKPLVVPPRGEHTATVFLLHGLGEMPQDIDGIYKYCRDKKNSNLQHIKWILPYAPLRPITKDHGMMKRGWFDVIVSHKDRREDGPGLLETVRYIDELIEDECASGIPEHRIVLAGHSQGAVVSVLAGLTGNKTRDSGQDGWNLAGVMSVSGYIPIKKVFAKSVAPHAREIPVFWGHGKDDRVIYVDAC
ncbi:alpha beta-hydrolase, partial [Coniophora puteana RWD-64-598 SS2]